MYSNDPCQLKMRRFYPPSGPLFERCNALALSHVRVALYEFPAAFYLPSRFKAMLYLLSIGRTYSSYLPYTPRSFPISHPTPYAGNAPSLPGLTLRTSLSIYGCINLTNETVHIATLNCLRADRTSTGQFPFCFLEGRSWLLMSVVHIHNFCL